MTCLEDIDEENLIHNIDEFVIDFLSINELEGLILTQNSLKIHEVQDKEVEELL